MIFLNKKGDTLSQDYSLTNWSDERNNHLFIYYTPKIVYVQVVKENLMGAKM